ncbi:MAG: cyclic 2,3-diphosphoglycerate synthase [Thermoplasmata archaeon]
MAQEKKQNVVIIGAAGRDFHNFNVYFRDKPEYNVVAFTAAQIPDIAGRKYPPELAGKLYPEGIPILDEADLPKIIKEKNVNLCVFAYSDVSFDHVMTIGSICVANGANYLLLGPKDTQIVSTKPVISICAVRTGCGKSQTTRAVIRVLKSMGKKVVAVRHPMPYGDLVRQRVQRFATIEDLKEQKCTIEEMEEYEPHIENGAVVFAGVDYEAILREAEKEADVIVWDGGNNDLPFYKSDLRIVVVDPHRAGHELKYHPGMANFLSADVIVINKMDSAPQQGIETIRDNIAKYIPKVQVIEADSELYVDQPELIRGKKVLVVDDGPTITHGNMPYGAGTVAANRYGAAKIVDPRPYAVGSIKETFKKYTHIMDNLPAMGYGEKQIKELEETIDKVPCDVIVSGTPINLGRLVKTKKPLIRVKYELKEKGKITLKPLIEKLLKDKEKEKK